MSFVFRPFEYLPGKHAYWLRLVDDGGTLLSFTSVDPPEVFDAAGEVMELRREIPQGSIVNVEYDGRKLLAVQTVCMAKPRSPFTQDYSA